jgi:hypothetical protein
LKKTFEVYIKKHEIKNDVIEHALKEYQNWKDGLISGSMPLVHNLHDRLCDVIRALYELPEHKEYALKYIEFWKNDKTLIRYYLPLKEMAEFYDFKEEFDEKSKSELWGQVSKLGWIFQIIKNGKIKHLELVNKLEHGNIKDRTEASHELLWGYNPTYGAWKRIQQGESAHGSIGGSMFDVNKIKPIVTRLHNFILSKNFISEIVNDAFEKNIKELGENSKITNPENSSIPINFSPSLSIEEKCGWLQIFKSSKKLKIAGINTRQFRLVKALFSPENSIEATYTGIFQNYDRVFSFIGMQKDKLNERLKDSSTMKSEMCAIIQFSIKEMQKNKAIRNYLKFEWQNETRIRMTIVPPEGKS